MMKHAYPPDVLEFVQGSLKSGEYASEDDIVVAGMRALREIKQRHQSLRDDIQAALAEVDSGQGEPWDVDDIKAELVVQLDTVKAGS
jgi:putative addiction module CopG family antidote